MSCLFKNNKKIRKKSNPFILDVQLRTLLKRESVPVFRNLQPVLKEEFHDLPSHSRTWRS